MTNEEKIALKRNILDRCKQEQKDVMQNLRIAMKEAQDSANEYGNPKDRYDSYRAQQMRKKDMFGQQLQKAGMILETFEQIDPEHLLDKPSFGAVIITDAQKIFVSVGLGKIVMDGEPWMVISPVVPFYKAIENLQAGDNYAFRAQKGKLLEIF